MAVMDVMDIILWKNRIQTEKIKSAHSTNGNWNEVEMMPLFDIHG